MRGEHLILARGAPGDTVCLSRLIEAIHRTKPKMPLAVTAPNAEEIFHGDIRISPPSDAYTQIPIDYKPGMDRAYFGEKVHYLDVPLISYQEQTGKKLRYTPRFPFIRLLPDEQDPPIDGGYWLLAAGSKGDIPIKQAPHTLFEQLVDGTPEIRWIQVGHALKGRMCHRQARIACAENLIGQTSLRELIRLVAHAKGVVGHLSLPFLLAAAFRRPCVVIAGGREPVHMHAYDTRYWSTFRYFAAPPPYTCTLEGNGCRKRGVQLGLGGVPGQEIFCPHPVADTEYGAVAGCMADQPIQQIVATVRALNFDQKAGNICCSRGNSPLHVSV